MRVLLTYDIRSNRRRRRVANVLADFGWRVQYSVFEVTNINEHQLDRCLWRVRRELDQSDSFRVYRLCAACSQKTEVDGAGDQDLPRFPHVIVI